MIRSLLFRAAALSSLLASAACHGGAPANARLVLEPVSFPPEHAVGEPGWFLSGGARDDYKVVRDVQDSHTAWLLEPAKSTYGKYGTWMRELDGAEYRGKRVRIRAAVKTAGATDRVDFWARAQAKDSPVRGRGLAGEWKNLPATSAFTEKEIILDVPEHTDRLQYGVGIAGPGRAWIDHAEIEVLGAAATETKNGYLSQPVADGWILTGQNLGDYSASLDPSVHHGGAASGLVRSVAEKPRGFGGLMQWASAKPYVGKRVRLTAYVKSEGVKDWAGLWMRVDGPKPDQTITLDNMQNRPIRGTTDWTRYQVVLDVPSEGTAIAYGTILEGAGSVWLDDVSLDVVDASVPTTASYSSIDDTKPRNLGFEMH